MGSVKNPSSVNGSYHGIWGNVYILKVTRLKY